MSGAEPDEWRALARAIAAERPLVAPPPGFRPMDLLDPFEAHLGPFFVKNGQDPAAGGTVEGAFRLAGEHLNANAIAHGGALATFADAILGHLAWRTLNGEIAVTLSLQMSFLAPARAGEFVFCTASLTRRTPEILFIAARFTSAERLVLTASSVWKVIRPAAGPRP